jgi:hypothetical protein
MKAKIEYINNRNSAEKFQKFQVVKGPDGTYTNTGGFYDITFTGDENLGGCPSSTATTYDGSCTVEGRWCTNATCTTYEDNTHQLDKTVDLDTSSFATSEYPTDIKETVDGILNQTYDDYVSGKKSSYDTAVTKIEKSFEAIEKCDKYFDADSADYLAFLNTKWQEPTVQFTWFYTYLNASSIVSEHREDVGYKQVGAECKYHPSGEMQSYDAETGTEPPHFDEKNTNTEGHYKTFTSGGTISCNNNNPKCSGGKQESKLTGLLLEKSKLQKYTSDTKYWYKCEYQADESGDKYTVYPYGGYVSESVGANTRAYTKYSGRLYVEYSTLKGTYQTNWTFSKLGSNIGGGVGKFDDDFTNGKDCTSNYNGAEAGSSLYCTFETSESLTKIRGCSDLTVSLFSGSNHWRNLCCDHGNCEVKNDDTLSFSFKIVDSHDLFPGTTGYSAANAPTGTNSNGETKQYAYNWFNTTKGQTNMKKIEDNSGNEHEFNKDRITYQFHLNAKAINTIKEYNAHINNYNSLVAGNYTSGTNETGPATKYHSKFIEDFYNDKIQLYRSSGSGSSDVQAIGSPVVLKTRSYGGTSALSTARKRVRWDGNASEAETP